MLGQTIVNTLHGAGFSLSLAPSGGVAVTPASKLTPELREIIRSGKAELIRWFTQPAANDPEPTPDPATWRELSQAYHLHHFKCTTCQAAGRGYRLRCGTGTALWTAYQETVF